MGLGVAYIMKVDLKPTVIDLTALNLAGIRFASHLILLPVKQTTACLRAVSVHFLTI